MLFQVLGANSYKLHTVEVVNPNECNVSLFDIRRKNQSNVYVDPNALTSKLLNNRPVIDIDYYKKFLDTTNEGDALDYLEMNLVATFDGANPSKCEFRAFAEINE